MLKTPDRLRPQDGQQGNDDEAEPVHDERRCHSHERCQCSHLQVTGRPETNRQQPGTHSPAAQVVGHRGLNQAL